MTLTLEKTTERPTRPNRIERWAPIAGLVFVALMLAGSPLIGDVPRPDAPAQAILDYLADGTAHTRNIVGLYVWVFGALAFLWFLTRLRSDLRRAEGGTGVLANLTFAAGVAFAAVWMVSAVIAASVANAIALRGASLSDPDLVRVLPPTGRLLLLQGAGFAGALMILAASAVILRTNVYPRWLGWLGIVAAITLVFDGVYQNITPLWVWVIAAAVVMLLRRNDVTTDDDPAELHTAAHVS